MADAVTYTVDGHVGVLTLNRPDNRNSMTPELLDAFAAASATARADVQAGRIRCAIVTGTGACFSAGADFKSTLQREGDTRAPNERSYAMYEPFLSLLDLAVPVIGALNGHAVGGGFGLALACDLRVAATGGAKYGANFTRLGLGPGMAISFFLPRLVGVARAAELLYTATLIDGEQALAIGLANRAVPAADVLPTALALARTIASNAPLAIRATKRALHRGLAAAAREHARDEAYAQAETVTTDDAKEGIAALLAKRDPSFLGR